MCPTFLGIVNDNGILFSTLCLGLFLVNGFTFFALGDLGMLGLFFRREAIPFLLAIFEICHGIPKVTKVQLGDLNNLVQLAIQFFKAFRGRG